MVQPPQRSPLVNIGQPDRKQASIERLRTISRLLDNAISIPGTDYGVGIDPLLGLLPVGGDLISSIFSAYMVVEAARLGLPRESLIRMVTNLILDTLAGTVPVLGDLFDVAWKANARNMELIESHMQSPLSSQKADKWFVFLLLTGLGLMVVGAATLTITIIALVLNMLGHLF
ncbi:MAG: DUF4112 domain-containing protein [Hormoscilla sp. GUM202]|nr:DUF4112 domain-containing protein [Hormoscilla sp. GUM202]